MERTLTLKTESDMETLGQSIARALPEGGFVALYGDLISIAEETGAEMIKLSGTKDEDVQKNIAAVRIGTACEAVFEDREDEGKESGWKLFTGDGCIGRLEAGAYKDDGKTRIAVAKVKKNVKKDKLDVWVYVI